VGPGLPTLGGDAPAYRLVVRKRSPVAGVVVDRTGAWSFGVTACANDQPAGPGAPTVSCAPEPPPAGSRPSEAEAKRVALAFVQKVGADVVEPDVRAQDLGAMWQVTVEPRVGGILAPGLASQVTVGPQGKVQWASGRLGTRRPLGDYPLIDTRAALRRLNEGTTHPAPTVTVEPREGSTPTMPPDTKPPPATWPPGATPPYTTTPGITIEPPEGPPVVKPPDGPPITIEHPDAPGPPTGIGQGAGAVPADGAVNLSTQAIATEGTPPTTIPGDVPVTGAEVVLALQATPDGSTFYLVPAYRFTARDGSAPQVVAVADRWLQRQ
jgi:hypothetical protein